MAADRPFKNFFAARDALDAEILAGKLKLKGTKHLVFRIILEHTLYQAKDVNGEPTPEDDGFVVDKFPGTQITTGVDGFALVSGAGETAVKDALKSLEHDDKLIERFKRPNVTGGRKPDRIRVNWALPEGARGDSSRWVVAAPEGPESDSSEQTESDSSEGPESDSSICRKQELLQEHVIRTSSEPGSARDDGYDICPSGEDRGGDPHTPRDSGQAPSAPDSSVDGEAVEPKWTGDGETARDNRLVIAEELGVGMDAIGAPLWRWLEALDLDADSTADVRALLNAAGASAGKQNPPAYFRTILPEVVTKERDRDRRAVELEQAAHQVA